MGIGICVHNVNVVNTVSPILPEATDQEVALLIRGPQRWHVGCDCCGFEPGRICLLPLCGAIYKDEGVVAHVRGGEIFSNQIRDPVTQLIVMRCDKAAPLTFKCMADGKGGVAAFALMRELWGV